MGTDYDAWLEAPYQEQYANEEAWERAVEEYEEDSYQEDLDIWLSENEGKTETDFRNSAQYERTIERIVESWTDYSPYF